MIDGTEDQLNAKLLELENRLFNERGVRKIDYATSPDATPIQAIYGKIIMLEKVLANETIAYQVYDLNEKYLDIIAENKTICDIWCKGGILKRQDIKDFIFNIVKSLDNGYHSDFHQFLMEYNYIPPDKE